MRVLERAIPKDYYENYPLMVNFSGGKDSLTCLTLALDLTDNVECLFFGAGFELPNTLPFVKERCKEYGIRLHVSDPLTHKVRHRPDGPLVGCHNLTDYIKHYGYFPTAGRRWCSIWCKQRPARVMIRENWGKAPLRKLVGVRAKESVHRKYVYGSKKAQAKYGGKYVRPDNECTGNFLVYPILDWSTPQVFEFLKERKVEIHEGYKLFGVSGCKWCPVHKPETVAKISEVYPGLYDDLLEAEAEIGKPAWIHKGVWLRDVVSGISASSG
jgi:3'-phosphoadenosine 5'-phosphosulfate sulfotransferase (PAPS reductase)/FAD synthetase